MKYSKFAAMIIVSTIAMYIMMYLNTFEASHIWFSETRGYMALYMGAAMAVIMLAFMLGMYANKKLNAAIFIGGLAVFAGCLYLVRSQVTISDTAYMKAMIPHHSIAILTSKRANIEDVRVRKLANKIIKAQEKEIKEMEWLIEDINKNGKVTSKDEAQQRPIPNLSGKQLN